MFEGDFNLMVFTFVKDIPLEGTEIYYDINKSYTFFCEFLKRKSKKIVLVAEEESGTILEGLEKQLIKDKLVFPSWFSELVQENLRLKYKPN